MIRTFLRALCLAALVAPMAWALESAGKIEQVTLYRDQALVTRRIVVEAEGGAIELIVTGLPEHVVPGSLFASAGAGIEIRAVRFRNRAVGDEPREEVRKLDEQLVELRAKLRTIAVEMEGHVARNSYLDKLEGFFIPAARTDLSRGVLDAAALERMTTFVFTQRKEIADARLAAERTSEELTKQIALAERQRQEISAGSSKTVREAVLFCDKKGGGPLDVRLSYQVSQVAWQPFYNLRATTGQTAVRLDYHALVQQMSGEDWGDVELVLSTASPRLRAQGPDLAPFVVALIGNTANLDQAKQQQADMQNAYANAQRNLRTAQKGQHGARGWADNNRMAWEMNKWANEAQNCELAGVRESDSGRARGSDEGLSASYAIAGRSNLASRADQQMIQIASLGLEAKLYHVAIPVLSEYVYRHADIVNTSEHALLAGETSVYLDGQFVGLGEMLECGPGQEFTVGLGTNSQLKATRELVSRNERVQGGNRVLELSYRFKLQNFGTAAADVRLFERLPNAGRESEIRVTLGASTPALSTDSLYLADERPQGILRWDLSVAAQASGTKAQIVPLAFTVEFDRTKVVGSPDAQQEESLREQFEQLQEKRYKK